MKLMITFKFSTVNRKGKRPLERPNCKCKDNIGMDLKEIVINTRNWVDLTQDRDYWRDIVNAPLNIRVP